MNDLPQIVRKGELRQSLEAIRDLLALRLVDADTKESASVAKQLVAVLAELDRLPNERRESSSGELAREYEARLTDTEDK